MSKLVKQSALYAIGEIVPKVISFFLLPVYTYYLSKSDYGILSYTNSFVMFFFVLSSLALNTFVLRYYFEKDDERYRKRLVGNIYLTIGGVNLLITLLAYWSLPMVIAKYNIQIPWKPYFRLALINNFLEVFSIIPLVMYRVRQQAKLFVLLSLSRVLLQMLLTFLFIVIFKWGLLGHYYGRLFSLIPYFAVYWIIIFRNVELNINIKQIKQGLIFSLPLLPGALAYLVLSLSDRIILERFVTVADLGIYSLAYTLAFTLNMVIQGFYKAVEPEMFKRFGTQGFAGFMIKTQNMFFFVIYLGAMFITLFSQEVFKIMASDEFYKGYLLIPILMIGVLMTGQNVIFGGIVVAEKKTKLMGGATMIGALVSLLFNISLIRFGGIYIAAISSAISFAVMNMILYKKMNFPEKSVKEAVWALLLLVLITFSLFYLFKLEFSIKGIIIKIGLFITYFVILQKIFKVDVLSILKMVRK